MTDAPPTEADIASATLSGLAWARTDGALALMQIGMVMNLATQKRRSPAALLQIADRFRKVAAAVDRVRERSLWTLVEPVLARGNNPGRLGGFRIGGEK